MVVAIIALCFSIMTIVVLAVVIKRLLVCEQDIQTLFNRINETDSKVWNIEKKLK